MSPDMWNPLYQHESWYVKPSLPTLILICETLFTNMNPDMWNPLYQILILIWILKPLFKPWDVKPLYQHEPWYVKPSLPTWTLICETFTLYTTWITISWYVKPALPTWILICETLFTNMSPDMWNPLYQHEPMICDMWPSLPTWILICETLFTNMNPDM